MDFLDKRLKHALHFLIVIVLLPLVFDIFILAGRFIVGDRLMSVHTWLPYLFSYLPLCVLLFIYAYATLEPFKKYGFRFNKELLWLSIGVGLVSAVMIYVVDLLTGGLADFGVVGNPSFGVAFGFIIVWGLLAPFTEEFLFRGLIQTSFSQVTKHWWTPILLASFFEVLWHVSVPFFRAPEGSVGIAVLAALPQAVYVLIFGAIGGWIYYRTKSLLGPILIHAIGNIGELVIFWMLV